MIVCLYQQHDGSFYAAFEVDSIEVPRSILELPGFIIKLDDIKRLLYEMNAIINTRKPKKVETSLEFKVPFFLLAFLFTSCTQTHTLADLFLFHLCPIES